ncbi:MAG TPA: sugar phosphate isomerase/epimerase family protein [Gemmatimonadales bacterium]|nr:sugar phosphate isomerase/epimerase family protein [Gemmatimonadales bacterium]
MAGTWLIGVCSWSLLPPDARTLAERARATGVSAVQLALDPIRLGLMSVEEVRRSFRDAGLILASGMMAMEGEDYSSLRSIRETGGVTPDSTWAANRAAAKELSRIAEELGIGLVSFHAGFLPEDPRHSRWDIVIGRLRELAGVFGERGAQVALETGQESARTLSRALEALSRERVGVNFDPGNLILYGSGDPVTALRALAPWVIQVHIKDALPAREEGTWGTEVPVGEGAVDWAALLSALRGCPQVSALVIEREAGPDRLAEISRARGFLETVLR